MEMSDSQRSRIAEAVCRFEQDQMCICPRSMVLDLDGRSLVVVLRWQTCPGEARLVANHRSAETLARLYQATFNVVRSDIEGAVGEILGCTVTRSELTVTPGASSGLIVFALTSDGMSPSQPRWNGKEVENHDPVD